MLQAQKTTLKSGLRVIRVPMPSVKSATLLAFCNTGSRYEEAKQFGIAHFFEHMVFKGTEKFPTAQDLAVAIDSIGADFNAFTSKEYTGYYVHAASEHVSLAAEVVSEMLLTPRLRQEDIDREKGVIVEEINMYLDSPPRHIANLFDQMVYRGSGLEHDILGLKETVTNFTSADFEHFLNQWYGLSNIVVMVAGDAEVVGDEAVLKMIEEQFSKKARGKRSAKTHQPRTHLIEDPYSQERLHVEYKATEQAHFTMGWPALKRGDKRRYALGLLSTIVGGNMSSRLFTEVREKRGLCYYVRSDIDQFHDGGMFGAAAGVDPSRVEEAIKVSIEQFIAIIDGSRAITAQDLANAKEYVAGKLVLGLEDPESVAQYFGIKELLLDELTTPAEVLEKYRAVTLEEITALAKEIITENELRFAIIGPYKEASQFEFVKSIA